MIKITYCGQCCFLIETSQGRIVTDPYLSDSLDRFATPDLPWKRAYPAPYTLAELNPDVVIISHAHGDHFDRDTVNKYKEDGGAAPFVVPAPIQGFAHRMQIRSIPAVADKAINIAGAEIIPIPCAHTALRTDEDGHFFELSYIIKADGVTMFFSGDMSMYDGVCEKIAGFKPDVMFLTANGRDYFRTASMCIGNLNCIEAAKLAAKCNCRMYIPMHCDLYPFNGCRDSWLLDSAADEGAPIKIMKPKETIEFSL